MCADVVMGVVGASVPDGGGPGKQLEEPRARHNPRNPTVQRTMLVTRLARRIMTSSTVAPTLPVFVTPMGAGKRCYSSSGACGCPSCTASMSTSAKVCAPVPSCGRSPALRVCTTAPAHHSPH